jgi:hypothetical protein
VTRLIDLPPDPAKRLAELECPNFATRPCVTGPVLSIPRRSLSACWCEVAHRLTAPEPHWRPGFYPPPGALSSSCSPARRMPPPLHCSVVHGRLLDCDDRGMGRSAPPVAMVRKDRRSGGFEASESRQCVT